VVDAWRTSILTALGDEQHKGNPLDHKLVKCLMGDFIQTMAELEARKAELDAQIKAATPDKRGDEAEGDEGDAADAGDDAPAVDEAQLKAWKQQLAALKKQIKAEQQGFAQRLNEAVDALDEAGAAELLLTVMQRDVTVILERDVVAQRQQVVAAFEGWWDKYSETLTSIEQSRDAAAGELRSYLRGLRYA
jgi:type I restriction enzyme M protein